DGPDRDRRDRPEAPAAAGVPGRRAGGGPDRIRDRPRRRIVGGPRAHSDDVTRPENAGGDDHMMTHRTGTREEWLAARRELLVAEKELTRRGDEVARRRRELPWVRIEKDYR